METARLGGANTLLHLPSVQHRRLDGRSLLLLLHSNRCNVHRWYSLVDYADAQKPTQSTRYHTLGGQSDRVQGAWRVRGYPDDAPGAWGCGRNPAAWMRDALRCGLAKWQLYCK